MSAEYRETQLSPVNIYGRLHRILLDQGQLVSSNYTRQLRVQGRRFGEMILKDQLNCFHRSYATFFKSDKPPRNLLDNPLTTEEKMARFDWLHDISATNPILQLDARQHISYLICRLGDTAPDSVIGCLLYPMSEGYSEDDYLVFGYPKTGEPTRIEPAENELFQKILAEFEARVR